MAGSATTVLALRGTPTAGALLALQATAGNAAVLELLSGEGTGGRLLLRQPVHENVDKEKVEQLDDLIGSAADVGRSTRLEHAAPRGLVQRQDAPGGTAEAARQEEKRFTVTLSTGTFKDLTEAEALAKLSESYDSLRREVEHDAGHHEVLQQDRSSNLAVGAGGFLTDVFIGRKIPPLSIWERPRNLLTAAKLALGSGAVAEAGQILKQAGDAYRESRATWRTYVDELELGGTATQVAIAAIPVAVFVIGVAWVAVASAGGAAAGGAGAGGATGGAAAGTGAAAGSGGTAAGATAAGGAAASGTVVVGGGVGGSAAMATTMATGNTVAGIAARAAGLMAAGDTAALTSFLTRTAATPAGRAALLAAAKTVVVAMRQPGLLQREFQFLKQLSESLFLFARGG